MEEQISKIFIMQEKQLLIFLMNILGAWRQAKKGTGLKILTPKQMLQRLPIALASCRNKSW